MKSRLSVIGRVLAVVFGSLWIAGAPDLDATADVILEETAAEVAQHLLADEAPPTVGIIQIHERKDLSLCATCYA
jgi:hypothetical protein